MGINFSWNPGKREPKTGVKLKATTPFQKISGVVAALKWFISSKKWSI